MPLYVADYLADTQHLSTAEHGAYLMLIMHYWRQGCLPPEDIHLARIVRATPKEWARLKIVIRPFFGEGWTHKRLDIELKKFAQTSVARSESGKLGVEARKNLRSLKSHDTEQANADGLLVQNESPAEALSTSYSTGSSVPSEPVPQPTFASLSSVDPLKPVDAQNSKPNARHRGSRILPDWQPSDADRTAAISEGVPSVDIERIAARFRDYWTSRPGVGGVKLDWSATWRNWVRAECDKRGWTPTQAIALGSPVGVYIGAETDPEAWAAWSAYKGRALPRDRNNGWMVPSRFPPSTAPHRPERSLVHGPLTAIS